MSDARGKIADNLLKKARNRSGFHQARRMLVISSGSTSDSENMMTAGFNAALCPDHVKELYGVLDSETFALTIHEPPKPPKK